MLKWLKFLIEVQLRRKTYKSGKRYLLRYLHFVDKDDKMQSERHKPVLVVRNRSQNITKALNI